MPGCFNRTNSSFMQDMILEESPGTMDDPKRILVVMDALREFSIDLVEWVLRNFTFRDCCTIRLLGIKPWLNIPLSAKSCSDIWSLNIKDLSTFQETSEFRNDPKHQKVQRLVELCQRYGVVPEIRTEMGHPLRLLVIEQITSLHATLVVFDRHHDKKYIQYYAEKVPCHMVVMNDNGEAELVRKRTCSDSEGDNDHVSESPISISQSSNSILSGSSQEMDREKEQEQQDKRSK